MADGGRRTPPPVDRRNREPPNINRDRKAQQRRETVRIHATSYSNRSSRGVPIVPEAGDIVEVTGISKVYNGVKYGVVKLVLDDESDANTGYREKMLHIFIPYKNGKIVDYDENWYLKSERLDENDLVDLVCTPVWNCTFQMRFKEYLQRFPFQNMQDVDKCRFTNPDDTDIWIVPEVVELHGVSQMEAFNFRGIDYRFNEDIRRVSDLFGGHYSEIDLEESNTLVVEDEEAFIQEYEDDGGVEIWRDDVENGSLLFYEPYLHGTGLLPLKQVHEMVDRSSETPYAIFAGAHSFLDNNTPYDPYMVQEQPDVEDDDFSSVGKTVALVPPYRSLDYHNQVRARADENQRVINTMINIISMPIWSEPDIQSSYLLNQAEQDRCFVVLEEDNIFATNDLFFIVAPIRPGITEVNENDYTFIVPAAAVKFQSGVSTSFLTSPSVPIPNILWRTNNEFRTMELEYHNGDGEFMMDGQIYEHKKTGKLVKLVSSDNTNVQFVPEDKNNRRDRFMEGRDNKRSTMQTLRFDVDYRVVKDHDLILWNRTFDRVRAMNPATVRTHIEDQLGTGFDLGLGVENLYIPVHIKVIVKKKKKKKNDKDGGSNSDNNVVRDNNGNPVSDSYSEEIVIHPHMFSAVDLQRYMLQYIEDEYVNRDDKNNHSLKYICPYDRTQIVAIGFLSRAEIRKRNRAFMRLNRITYDPYTPPYNELKGRRNSLRMRASNDNNNNNVSKKRSRRPVYEAVTSVDQRKKFLQMKIDNMKKLIDQIEKTPSEGDGLDVNDLREKLKRYETELLEYLKEKAENENNNGGSSSGFNSKKRMKKQFKNLKL